MAAFDSLSTPIASTDTLGELLWSNAAQIESQHELYFSRNGMSYVAKKGGDPHKRQAALPIVLYEQFGQKAGSMISIPLRKQLARTPRTATVGTYTYGATSMLGNEESLSYYDLDVRLGLLKHATGRDAPDFYDHNSSLDLEADSEDALKTWLTEIHEEQLVDCMYEKYPYFIQQQLSVSAVDHPRTYYAGGVSAQGDMTSAATFSGQEAMRLRSYARNRKLTPVKVDGQSLYVVLADTFVCASLRLDPVFRELKDAAPRGPDNPIVSGAIGVYQGLLIYEYERMRVMTTGASYANIGRVILMGADALAVGYGSRPRLRPRKEDSYGDLWGLAIRQVWGASRCEYQDNGNTLTVQQSSCEWRVWRTAETFAA